MKIVRYTNIRSMFGMISLMLCLLIPCVAVAQDDEDKKDEKKTVVPKRDKLREVSNPKAAVEAFKIIVKSQQTTDNLPRLADEIMRQHKKNVEVATGLAEVFCYNSGVVDTVNTMKFVNMAIDIDKTYAPAYFLAGDFLARKCRDTLKAVKWFEAGVAANPKHPDCYLAYTKIMATKDISKSEDMFNKLHVAIPDYPVYLKMSEMYDRLANANIDVSENLIKAIDCLEKEKPENLSQSDWNTFAALVMNKGLAYQIEICKKGLSYFPRYHRLNRSAAIYSFKLKSWEDCQTFSENLLFNSDSAVVKPNDIFRYACCFLARKNYTKGVEWFRKHIAIDSISEDERQNSLINLWACHSNMGDYGLAEKDFVEYLDYCRAKGLKTRFGIDKLYDIYEMQAQECFGEEKLACFAKTDSLALIVDSRENIESIEIPLLKRWWANAESRLNHLDISAQSAEQIEILYNAREIDKSVKDNMPNLYAYLSWAYLLGKGVKKNLYKADDYCYKSLELEPNDRFALQLREAIDKSLPKSRRRR